MERDQRRDFIARYCRDKWTMNMEIWELISLLSHQEIYFQLYGITFLRTWKYISKNIRIYFQEHGIYSKNMEIYFQEHGNIRSLKFSSFTSRKDILCRWEYRQSGNTWMAEMWQRWNIWLWTWAHLWQWQWIYIWQWPWIYFLTIMWMQRTTVEAGRHPVEWAFPPWVRCSSDVFPPHPALAFLSGTLQCWHSFEARSQSQS